MPAPTDALRAKTDAELLFFIENPSFYQPELVETARQELRRRGALPVSSLASPGLEDEFDEPARRTPWLVLALVAVVLVVAGLSIWGNGKQEAAIAKAARPGRLSPDSLKLETVVAQPLPAFDTEKNVDQQLALIPEAEKTQAQALRQFRGLSRRFWQAQNPSAYLVSRVDKNPSYSVYTNQISLVQTQWNDLYKGLVYNFNLPPTMADHLSRMRVIARIQRATLKELQEDCLSNRSLVLAGSTVRSQDTVQYLLQPLQHRTGGLQVHL